MRVIERIEEYKPLYHTPVLTIGMFDGLHLGHQTLLKKLKEEAQEEECIVMTYFNHPATILRPDQAPDNLSSWEEKLQFLEEHGVDTVFKVIFSKEFASQTPEEFLQRLRKYIPFKTLVLGHDAAIGNNRAGDIDKVKQIASPWDVKVVQVPPHRVHGEIVSSSLIRRLIKSGDLGKARIFFGRPFTISGIASSGSGNGRKLGAPTLNLEVAGRCLPPEGVYLVSVNFKGHKYPAIANLGKAPTLHAERQTLLEVHLLEQVPLHIDQSMISVEFLHFVRTEMKFETVDKLKQQIASDIAFARDYFR